ncbi:hypothetical protein POTOM_056669 [Populus tomentosa]|uniref:Uncharacterized protein n=1 Tax=Populus tomentosa TaxID=118781 RepID=A0A8X8C2Q6_POPTO|nr:hypothetical protein POTOM_056669 [Populus tomentosa]
MYPDDARSYDAGDDHPSLDASEIPTFFKTMVPTVAQIFNVFESGTLSWFAAGVVISPYGHILTINTGTGTNRTGMHVSFKDDDEGFKAAICHEYDDHPFLLLKLESERDDFPYARLATSAAVQGCEIHFIHVFNYNWFRYLKGMVSCPNRNLSYIIKSDEVKQIAAPSIMDVYLKGAPIQFVEVGAIYDSEHVRGSPFFSKNGTVVGIYYFSAFNLAYGFNVDYLETMSPAWEEKITECQPAKRTKLTSDGLASSSQSGGQRAM